MRLLVACALALSLTSCGASAPPANPPAAADWSLYGAPITVASATPLS